MKDNITGERLSKIITKYLTDYFMQYTMMSFLTSKEEQFVKNHPDEWYVIKGTKRKLGKDYAEYIGIRLIYKKYISDTHSGFPSDQLLLEHRLDQRKIGSFIDKLVKACNIEKKIEYKEGNKRLTYELFMKKEDVDINFALKRIEGTL